MKKTDKIFYVKIGFVLLIFASALFVDEKSRIEVIKAGVGVITAFMIEYGKPKKIKED